MPGESRRFLVMAGGNCGDARARAEYNGSMSAIGLFVSPNEVRVSPGAINLGHPDSPEPPSEVTLTLAEGEGSSGAVFTGSAASDGMTEVDSRFAATGRMTAAIKLENGSGFREPSFRVQVIVRDVDLDVTLVANKVSGEGGDNIISGESFSLQVTARKPDGSPAADYRGTISFETGDQQATLPGNYEFSTAYNGQHTFTGIVLKSVGGEVPTRRIYVKDTTNESIDGEIDLTVWFRVTSTIEVTSDEPAACGVPVPAGSKHVALPADGDRICNKPVRVRNLATGLAADTTVLDVGPWYPHSKATPGNPCVGPEDPYWTTTGRPRVENEDETLDTNDSGMDLGEGTAEEIGIVGKGEVLWRFR